MNEPIAYHLTTTEKFMETGSMLQKREQAEFKITNNIESVHSVHSAYTLSKTLKTHSQDLYPVKEEALHYS